MMEIQTFLLTGDDTIPNNPELPLVCYREAFDAPRCDAATVQHTLSRHGWTGSWVNGIYSYHHFHSTAHEVLVVIGGSASVQFGGSRGETVRVGRGDAVVIPAGVGHCNLGATADFRVVGAYPRGQRWDLLRQMPDDRSEVLESIREVPLPEADPITGNREPLLSRWETR